MPIRAVTFDVGGTLIRPWPSVGHVYAGVAARHGVAGATAELLDARFKAAWKGRERFEHTRDGWARLVDEVFKGLTPAPSGTFFPELYDAFALPGAWRVFDDVVPALGLARGAEIRLGIISNWDERLRRLLRGLNLDVWFETIVVSSEVGSTKPDREIFEHAAAGLGLSSGEILHVGDSLVHDVHGAEAAGFRAVQIDRAGDSVDRRAIGSLTEIPAMVRSAGEAG